MLKTCLVVVWGDIANELVRNKSGKEASHCVPFYIMTVEPCEHIYSKDQIKTKNKRIVYISD